jgi:transposase
VAEQRYQAVLAVIADGLSVSQVADKVEVSRQTLHAWLARYEAEGVQGLVDRSHRPARCPHQMPAYVVSSRRSSLKLSARADAPRPEQTFSA